MSARIPCVYLRTGGLKPFLFNHGKTIHMDKTTLEMFRKENDAWRHMVDRREKEIPRFERLLAEAKGGMDRLPAEVCRKVDDMQREIVSQEERMTALHRQIDDQQGFLSHILETESEDSAQVTLIRQNKLRQMIREAERAFLELKCVFVNQLSTLHA
jgi:hypothetical protein